MLPAERWWQLLGLCLLLAGGQQLAAAGVIKAKAWLAPVLIERAWEESLAKSGPVPPWPWADTWPVARLQVPAAGVNLLVLAGDSGNALAFGPGHARASAQPGQSGTVVIGGHRDTHFALTVLPGPIVWRYRRSWTPARIDLQCTTPRTGCCSSPVTPSTHSVSGARFATL
jgi:hypothetical protein